MKPTAWMRSALLRLARRFGVASVAREAGESIRFEGAYRTWADAQRASTGYDSKEILARTLAATLKVKRGEAAYERDSVLFEEIEYSFPLLAGLLHAATAERRLGVLDFGGALGSSYFQNRHLLQGVDDFAWGVVEQEDVAACGRQHVAEGPLQFFSDLDACVRTINPNFVLLSGVLSYLPDPLSVLRQLVAFRPSYICFDRSLVAVEGSTRLTVQVVPSQIYAASYPCWILEEAEMLAPLAKEYRLVFSFDAMGGDARLDGLTGAFKGYLFARVDPARAPGVG